MTDKTITAEAQWALLSQGASPGDDRILACSRGELSAQNFEEAIDRFSPGIPSELPQVTVSYLQDANRPGVSYLALAAYKRADELDGDGGQQPEDDDGGVRIIRYFCVPYQPLAQASASYQALYRALKPIRLPRQDGAPIRVAISGSSSVNPPVDGLAVQSAALLLTGRPVCVLVGAEQTSADERLQFIDAVMTLLPYGLRFRMTAATWATSTNRDHRFRLFFSDAARPANPPDCVLHWGQHPEAVPPRAPGDEYFASEYRKWLDDKISQPTAALAQLTTPIGFGREQIRRMLEEMGVASPDRSLNYSATGHDLIHPAPIPPTQSDLSPQEWVLRDCAEHVRMADQRLIKSDITKLMTIAGASIDNGQRAHYREIIKETGLLQYGERPGRNAVKLYSQLLRVAFALPLSYAGYCQLEDCLRSLPPHPAVLQAVENAGTDVLMVKAIVYWSLRGVDPKKLTGWYASGEPRVDGLINLLAVGQQRPHHARILCDVALDLLATSPTSCPTAMLQATLRQHGFLAHTLQANHLYRTPDEEVDVLSAFLKAAYPHGLDQIALDQILAGSPQPPTPPLLAAVLLLTNPIEARLARQAFVRGSIRRMALDEETQTQLANVLRPTPRAGS